MREERFLAGKRRRHGEISGDLIERRVRGEQRPRERFLRDRLCHNW
jgi:hypothetical protein